MDTSLLYDAIYEAYIADYHEELEKEENDNFYKWEREAREALEKSLNAEEMKLVYKFEHSFNMRKDYINFQTSIKLLSCGVKIGMELQKSFNELDED